MKDYVRISLETNLFFARIMKEHALFLEAGFVGKDRSWIRRADFFRIQFEDLLRQTVRLSNRMVSGCILHSDELSTSFTLAAEMGTSRLSGIPIDSRITGMEQRLESGRPEERNRQMWWSVRKLNERAVWLLNGLISFKENILREVGQCRLFTLNYPLLIEHILREARLYRATLKEIMADREICLQNLQDTEDFWNRIMMEHALFIRGLLDPSEEKLIAAANEFALDFKSLLEQAKTKDCRAENELRENLPEVTRRIRNQSLAETRKIRDFKAAGTKGLLECQISSIMLPLLADHVLREANHYIRILECGYEWRE